MATLGEAVGLASQDQLAAERRKREEAERKLANLQDQYAKADEGATETAGILADVADILFGSDQRVVVNGYEGVSERATTLVLDLARAREEVAKALADIGAVQRGRDEAVREACKAKTEAAQAQRQMDQMQLRIGQMEREAADLMQSKGDLWKKLRARDDRADQWRQAFADVAEQLGVPRDLPTAGVLRERCLEAIDQARKSGTDGTGKTP
jgi:chromosome segregation ATPase